MDERQRKPGYGRRGILATAGAATAALATAGLAVVDIGRPALGEGKLRAEPLIPPDRRGIILYSVRDRIQAAPDNSGVPYGFERVLAHLATIGYSEVEFAGYTQSTQILGRQITPAEIRKILDDNGLVANGTHTNISPGSLDAEMDIAQTLGMAHIGTGGDPSGSAYQADWDRAAQSWNEMGARATARGLKLYTHNHDAAYDFLLDAGPFDSSGRPTRSSGIRKLEYFMARTDPKNVWFEMDILWAYLAQHRFRSYVDSAGRTRTDVFDPILTVANRTRRFPLFHAKDGDHTANGYQEVPLGEGDINFQQFFQTIEQPDYHHANYEMDDAQLGGSSDPGKSLRVAAQSYDNMSALTVYTR